MNQHTTSLMHEVQIEWEIYIEHDFYGNTCPFILSDQNTWIPQKVRDWMVGDVIGTYQPHKEEKWPMVEYSTIRTVTYEVEVRYREEGGMKKAFSATCQTADVPNYLKGWVEAQAMIEFNQHPLPERRETV